MTTPRLLACLFLGICTWLSCGEEAGPSQVAEVRSPAEIANDARFSPSPTLENMADFLVGYAEETMISLAQAEVATDKAVRPEVRAFAEQIRVDHREMYNEVFRLGGQQQIAIPVEGSDALYESVIRLAAQPASAIDQAYLKEVIDYHERLTPRLNVYQTFDAVPAVRDLARGLSQMAMRHLDQARSLNRTLLVDPVTPAN